MAEESPESWEESLQATKQESDQNTQFQPSRRMKLPDHWHRQDHHDHIRDNVGKPSPTEEAVDIKASAFLRPVVA